MKLHFELKKATLMVAFLAFFGGCWLDEPTTPDTPIETPLVFNVTNQEDRAKQQLPNLDWFKAGSTYIWEDWQLRK